MKYAGFLLIEVALVLMLILISITLALPQFTCLKRSMVHCEIKKLIAECFYQRLCAIASHKELSIQFDCVQNCYTTSTKKTFFQAVRMESLPGLKGPPSQPKKAIDNPITFNNSKIVFYPDGTMSSGTIYFVDTSKTSCYALTIATGQAPFLRHYEFASSWVQIS